MKILLLAMIVLLVGCATTSHTVPYCERYRYQLAEHDGEEYVVLDMEGMAKLGAMLLGLSKGTCRLPTTVGAEV